MVLPTQDQIFNIFDKRCYNSIQKNNIKSQGKLIKTSSYGWVATIIHRDKRDDTIMYLNNPITGNMFSLPPLEDCSMSDISMVVLSCNPCMYPDECVVAYLSRQNSIGLISLAGKKWSSLTTLKQMETILFHKGKLYALDSATNLLAIDFHYKYGLQTSVVVQTGKVYSSHHGLYLVESLRGELMMIMKRGSNPFIICDFKVYKLVITDDKKGHWDEIHKFGNDDEVLFLDEKRKNAICSKCRNLQPDSV